MQQAQEIQKCNSSIVGSLFGCNGVPQDIQEARHFKMASDQGHHEGQNESDESLVPDDGVPQNEREAVRYFKMASSQGHVLFLFFGMGEVQRDDVGCHVMLPIAQGLYSLFLSHGKCVPWRPEERVRSFEIASKNGDRLG